MPGGHAVDRVLTWRRQVTSVWVLLLVVGQALLQVLRLFDPIRRRSMDTVDWIFTVFIGVILVVSVAYFVFEMVRTRVRLLEAGVEVRQWKTRLYQYAEIAEVKLDRATNDRTITLELDDGRSRRLPAPTRGLRKSSDPTLIDTVQAIRERASLEPARRLP